MLTFLLYFIIGPGSLSEMQAQNEWVLHNARNRFESLLKPVLAIDTLIGVAIFIWIKH
jgi:hypothetical protein